MRVVDAQAEVRTAYLGGCMGQLVSALVWLASAAAATWGSVRAAVIVLVVGGFFIFPLMRLGLWLIGHRVHVSPGNPLNALGMQVAFVLPLSLPVAGAAALYRMNWLYPAFMVLLGAHYLPFVFLYGMRMFAVLATVLIAAGMGFALYLPQYFAAGGWFTGAVLLVFAAWGRWSVREELAAGRATASALPL